MPQSQNSNLFLPPQMPQSNTGAPKRLPQPQRMTQVLNTHAQQQYSTNVVTTQSRKGPQERFVGGEKQGQREPTPVFI